MGWFDALALLANVGSLVGFALTLYVYARVRKLREHYALIGRVPVDVERLKRITSELADLNYAEAAWQKHERRQKVAPSLQVQLSSAIRKLEDRSSPSHQLITFNHLPTSSPCVPPNLLL